MEFRRQFFGVAASLLAFSLTPALAAEPHACAGPNDAMRLSMPLPRTSERLAKRLPLTIVAIGSSSTAGAGASSAANCYPSRLEAELKTRFPGIPIKVINRGVNGEEIADMLKRFADGVIKEKPDLVLWQVGTNSVLRNKPLEPHTSLILEGLKQLKNIDADVVLIDPQYAPRVIERPDAAEGMVRLIAATAKTANVDLVQRFEVMRWWHDHEHMEFAEFISPDKLHMNDWGYGCLAKLIGRSIVEAATRNMASAHATAATQVVTH